MKVILKVSQIIIKFALIFSLFFIWLKFYINSLWQIIALSSMFTIILMLILANINKSKKTANIIKNKQQKEAETMFEKLIITQDSDFFYYLAKTQNNNIKKDKDSTIIKTFDNSTIVLYPFLKNKSLDNDDIVEITQKLKNIDIDKLIVCCNEFDKSTQTFIKNFKYEIMILDKYSTYEYLFKEYEFYPEIEEEKQKSTKIKIKEMFNYAFNKNKAKPYFFSAIFLLAISFTINTNLYYCIISTVLIIFSIICIIKPSKKTDKTINIT